MQIQFRQGIIQYQPHYLTWSGSGSISLSTTNKPTMVAFAFQTSNYLHIEERSQVPMVRWTGLPVSSGNAFWIYWDMDVVTSQVTYGYTTHEPVHLANAPSNPAPGQNWFDLTNFMMKEWNGQYWIAKIRVIAAKVEAGNNIISPPTGTQVGMVGPTLIGKLLYDSSSQPIRKATKHFVTTEDVFYFNGADVRTGSLETTVLIGKAIENIPEYSVVKLTNFDEFRLANYEDSSSALIGISTETAAYGESIRVVPLGIVTNPNWDWPTVNAKVWIGQHGELTLINPNAQTQQNAIARVISPSTLLFGQGYHADVPTQSATGIELGEASANTFGAVKLSVAPVNPSNPIAVGDNDARLFDSRTPTPHAHSTTDITYNGSSLSTILNQQTDEISEKLSRAGGTMTGPLRLYGDPVNAFDAATRQYVDSQLQNAEIDLVGIAPVQVVTGGTTTVSVSPASTTASGSMSAADKTKLDGISTGANNYIHPIADGYLHVPATGNMNSGKVLTAGSTAGSLSWAAFPSGAVESVAGRSGVVILTKNDVGLGFVDNTSDANKPISAAVQAALDTKVSVSNPVFTGNAATATTLQTPRLINGVSFDGSANITITAVDPIARISSSEKGTANGVATLDASGLVPSTQLPSYVDDVLEYASLAAFPATGTTGKIYIDTSTNKPYRWSGSTYIHITGGAVDSVAGQTGVVLLTKSDVGLTNVSNIAQVTSVSGTAPILSSGGTTPMISVSTVTTSAAGVMSAADKVKLDGIATSATNYTHPTGDGNLHVPATGTGNSGKVLTAGATAGSLSWATPAPGGVTSVTGTAPIVSSGGVTPAISISNATTSTAGAMSATDKLKLDNLSGTLFVDHGNVSGSLAINASAGKMQRLKLTGATTVSFNSWPPSGTLGELLLEVEAGGINLSLSGITWIMSDGSFTTNFLLLNLALQTVGIDFITLWTRNGGTTVYGKVIR